MCGIVGVVDPARPVDAAVIERMRDRLSHRGPDGSGTWVAPPGPMSVALGHRRLSILDLSELGHQPMLSPDGRVAITFNGLLYNFVELRRELEREGMGFRSTCDTEVLLGAYLAWGREFVRRLNGMFAFAIYDARDESLFVARDRLGEKPLYSTRLPGGGWAFASEIKALLAHPGVTTAIEEEALSRWVVDGYAPPGGRVMFAGIEEFPPAHALAIECRDGSSRSWRYWTPDYGDVDEGIGLREASDQLASHLDRSVDMRLRADVPIGAFLSGGQDSSAIVGTIWELLEQPAGMTVYSARFEDDPSISEDRFIDAVLEQRPFASEAVSPSPELLADSLDRLLWHHEQPIASGSMFLEWEILRNARADGTVVMLDGQGADELLAGYEYYFLSRQLDLLTRGEDAEFAVQTARYRSRLAAAASDYPDADRRFGDPSMPEDSISFWREEIREGRLPPLAEEDRLPGVPPEERSGYLRRQLARGMLYESLPLQLHSADRNAMAFGVETRFPFLDYELVDWAARLPDELLIRWGWMKYLLRTAAWRRVPEAVRWRRDKVGFMAPQDAWLRGPLRNWAEELLLKGPITERPEYGRLEVPRLWQEHRKSKANHSDTLWRVLSANRWLQMWGEGAWWPASGVGAAGHPAAA